MEAICQAQQKDQEREALYQKVGEEGKIIINSNTNTDIMEDLIYRVVTLPHKTLYQLYIPAGFREHLLEYFHQDPLSDHLGRHKTYRRSQHLIYWPKMNWHVQMFCQDCHVCQA